MFGWVNLYRTPPPSVRLGGRTGQTARRPGPRPWSATAPGSLVPRGGEGCMGTPKSNRGCGWCSPPPLLLRKCGIRSTPPSLAPRPFFVHLFLSREKAPEGGWGTPTPPLPKWVPLPPFPYLCSRTTPHNHWPVTDHNGPTDRSSHRPRWRTRKGAPPANFKLFLPGIFRMKAPLSLNHLKGLLWTESSEGAPPECQSGIKKIALSSKKGSSTDPPPPLPRRNLFGVGLGGGG